MKLDKFKTYLRDTLIPDLTSSGYGATASDFQEALNHITALEALISAMTNAKGIARHDMSWNELTNTLIRTNVLLRTRLINAMIEADQIDVTFPCMSEGAAVQPAIEANCTLKGRIVISPDF